MGESRPRESISKHWVWSRSKMMVTVKTIGVGGRLIQKISGCTVDRSWSLLRRVHGVGVGDRKVQSAWTFTQSWCVKSYNLCPFDSLGPHLYQYSHILWHHQLSFSPWTCQAPSPLRVSAHRCSFCPECCLSLSLLECPFLSLRSLLTHHFPSEVFPDHPQPTLIPPIHHTLLSKINLLFF